MTKSHRRFAATAFALITAVVSAQADGEVNVDVRSNLPVSCGAGIVTSELVTITPLLINASIKRDCNTKHDLSVTYAPLSVMQPNRLFIAFDGAPANVKLPGAQVFTNLPHTDSVKPLTIRYSGGTLLQRKELARTWGITVTAH